MSPRRETAIPADTSPEVWRAQMRALAAMTPARRLATWEALNEELSVMEEQAIRRLHPDFSEREVALELVRRRHGAPLAAAVAAWATRTAV
jgi:hypothetical protein